MRLGLLGVAFASAAVGACAAEQSSGAAHFRFATPVLLSDPGSGLCALAEIVLPAEASQASRDDLADIRVARAESGEFVPCLVDYARDPYSQTVRRPVRLKLTRAEELEGGQLRVSLEREDGERLAEPLSGVAIHTPLRDFDRTVTVEQSSDGVAWLPGVRDSRIIDLSSHADFRSTEIRLPSASRLRYLRLTFDRMDEVKTEAGRSVTTAADGEGKVQAVERSVRESVRPFRVDRVDGWAEETEWVRDSYRLTDREIHVSDGAPAELSRRFPDARLIRFEAGRVPLERLVTASSKDILSLSYQLFAKSGDPAAGEDAWRLIASGRLTQVRFREIRKEQMEVVFPESRATAYCLVLEDRAGAADLEVLRGRGPLFHVVFPASAGCAYTLLAGNPDMPGPPGYQADQVRLLLGKYKPVAAKLDGWRENPAWHAPKSAFSAWGATWALSAAVVLAVIVLAVAVGKALKHLPENPA